MLGHAMDFYIPGVPLEQLRAIGLRLQRGGVGFYPTSGSPFVHMDTGGVRHWPRMTREQLVKVFPDGRTVHIPTDGRPLPGYALALADIKKRGGNPSDMSIDAARSAGVEVAGLEHHGVNPFAKFLGLARDDEDDDATAAAGPPPAAAEPLRTRAKAAVVAAVARVEDKLAHAEDKLCGGEDETPQGDLEDARDHARRGGAGIRRRRRPERRGHAERGDRVARLLAGRS